MVAPLRWGLASGGGWHVLVFWLAAALYFMMALANGVALFVKEKEERKWDVLLATPLTSWEIIRAKLLAGLAALAPLGLILFLILGLLCWGYGVGFVGGLMTGVSLALAHVVGGAASLRARTLPGAFSFTFAAMGSLLLLVPLLVAIRAALPGTSWDNPSFPFALIPMTNPGPYPSLFTEAGFGIGWAASYTRDEYARLLRHFLMSVVLHSAAVLGIILRMRVRFNAVTGRS